MSNIQTEGQTQIKDSTSQQNEQPTSLTTVPYFAYSLIRDTLIPELLGKDTDQVLYWAGKSMARKFPLDSIDEIISFFHEAGWGTLVQIKTEKHTLEFELKGELVKKRFYEHIESSFHLEGGFIAEQIQRQKKRIAESYLTSKEKAGKVIITVKWDKKDTLS